MSEHEDVHDDLTLEQQRLAEQLATHPGLAASSSPTADATETGTASDELSEKEQRFVEEYCVDWNGAAAARRVGYSRKGARYDARDLLKKPRVRAAIDAQIAVLSEGAQLRAEAVLVEITKVAFMPVRSTTVASKVRALELLGKHRRLFVERSEVSAALDIQIHISGARERIASRLARLIGA